MTVSIGITSGRSGPSPFTGPSRICTGQCPSGVAFATTRIGYAYGPRHAWVTLDGGRTWQQRHGGAIRLITLRTTVIEITASDISNCLPGCNYRVQWAKLGTASRRAAASLPATPNAFDVSLLGSGNDAYFVSYGHSAGGEPSARAKLFRTLDGGRRWTIRRYDPHAPTGPLGTGDPCPEHNQRHAPEIDTTAIALSAQGVITVQCLDREHPQHRFTITSTDHARTFGHRGHQQPPGGYASYFAAEGRTPRYLPSGFGWRLARRSGYQTTTNSGHTWSAHHFT